MTNKATSDSFRPFLEGTRGNQKEINKKRNIDYGESESELFQIKNKQIYELMEFGTTLSPIYLTDEIVVGINKYIERLYSNTETLRLSMIDLIKNVKFIKIAFNPTLLRFADCYLQGIPIVSNIQLFQAIPETNAIGDTEYHRDDHGGKVIKLFIPLNTLLYNEGSNYYIARSNKYNFLHKIKSDFPQSYTQLYKKTFLTYRRSAGGFHVNTNTIENDLEILEHFHRQGHCFIEDTRGFHRGSIPRKSGQYRRMLIVTYVRNSITAVEEIRKISFMKPYLAYLIEHISELTSISYSKYLLDAYNSNK